MIKNSVFHIFRSSYTRRIFEIIGNIDKQRGEINKVLADTRNVQKDINQLTGRVDRSFAVTDEMIFKVKISNLLSNSIFSDGFS